MYAVLPSAISPAVVYEYGYADDKKDCAVEFNFVIQNLVSAWPRRFDKLHDFCNEVPIKDVLPDSTDSTDLARVVVKKSNSLIAKIIRNPEEVMGNMEDSYDAKWKGRRCFREEPIEIRGLRMRKNASSDINEQ